MTARTPVGVTGPPLPTGEGTPAVGRVARGAAASAVGTAVSALLNIGLVVLVTRGFHADEAGSLFASTSMFLIVVAVAELGTDTGILHWLPKHRLAGERDLERLCVRTAVLAVLATSLVCAVAMVLFGSWMAGIDPSTGSAGRDMTQVLAIFVPFAALSDLLLAVTRVNRSMRATVVIDRLGRSLAQVVAVAVAAGVGADDRGLALAWALPYAPTFVAAARAAHRTGVMRLTLAAGRSERERLARRGFWSFTLPRSVARVLQVGLQRADIVLVAAMRSPADAAVYTAATRFLVLGLLGVQSVQQVIQPHLSHALARRDDGLVQRLFRVATVWIVLAAWPPYLVMIVYGHSLLRIFGGGYTGGSEVISMLAIAMLFAAICGPVDVVLTMGGRSGLSLLNTALSLAVDIGIDILLIPSMGIRGAAIGWTVATVVRNVLPAIQVRYLFGLSFFNRALTVTAAACTACWLALPLVGRMAGANELVVLGVAAATFTVLVWSTRRLTELDVAWGAIVRRRPVVGT